MFHLASTPLKGYRDCPEYNPLLAPLLVIRCLSRAENHEKQHTSQVPLVWTVILRVTVSISF